MNCFWFFVCLGFFLRYRWKEIDIAVLGSSVIRTSCLIGKSQSKERQPASFWMTSAYPSRLHLDLGGSLPPYCAHTQNQAPGPGSLAASLRPLIHVSLPFRRRAAQQTPNWWEHVPAITARLPQLTSLRSFLGGKRCQVSEVSCPLPKPLDSWGPTPATICLLGRQSWGQLLFFQPVALDRCNAGRFPAPASQDCKWPDL